MVLVDTSVWIDHFHQSDQELTTLLEEGRVLIHPFIIGELASGNIRNRKEILEHLQTLQNISMVDFEEILFFIDKNGLAGKGLGYIDIHLIASCLIGGVKLFTRDKRILKAATDSFPVILYESPSDKTN